MARETVSQQLALAARRSLSWPNNDLYTVVVRDSAGAPIDITSTTLSGAIPTGEALDSTSVAAITITKTAPTTGTFTFTVPGATTASMTVGRTYWYHVTANGTWTNSVPMIVMHGPVYVEG